MSFNRNDDTSKQPSSNASAQESKQKQSGKKVLYASFDYDGCLARFLNLWLQTILGNDYSDFVRYGEIKHFHEQLGIVLNHRDDIAAQIVKDNEKFLDELIAKAISENFAEMRVMIGTNRQSLWRDSWNAKQGSGSCVPVYALLEQYLKTKFPNTKLDKFMMGDLMSIKEEKSQQEQKDASYKEGQSSEGYAVTEKMLHKTPQSIGKSEFVNLWQKKYSENVNEYLWDYTKVTLLYTQLQRAAEKAELEKSGELIELHFYDDKTADILIPLYQFFNANPELIPKNVSLHLHQLAFDPHTLQTINKDYGTVLGKGERDVNYKDTVVMTGALVLDVKDVDSKPRESIKMEVYKAATARVSLGLAGAPDVKHHNDKVTKLQEVHANNPAELKKVEPKINEYTADHFKKGRQLAAQKAAKVTATKEQPSPQI